MHLLLLVSEPVVDVLILLGVEEIGIDFIPSHSMPLFGLNIPQIGGQSFCLVGLVLSLIVLVLIQSLAA